MGLGSEIRDTEKNIFWIPVQGQKGTLLLVKYDVNQCKKYYERYDF
jgi:hypothetical protein